MSWHRALAATAVAALGLLLVAAEDSDSVTLGSVERTCPFTGRVFSGRFDVTGTRFCQRLDLKPIGSFASPAQIPVCPDDGFIVFKPAFSAAELDRLRPWLASDAYRRITRDETTYYRYAQTLRALGEPSAEVAWRLVQATWQVERDGDKYRRYANEALAELALVEASDKRRSLEPNLAAALAAELERRMLRFDAARVRLEALQAKPDLPSRLRELVAWELELVAVKDPTRHYLPRGSEEHCRALD
jgi:hypothetical protein